MFETSSHILQKKLKDTPSNNEVIGFSLAGRKFFRNLADILITFFRKKKFAGDVMGRVRILKDWNVSYPYPIQAQTQTKTLDEGQRTDVKHFRRMVALIIKKCHLDYRTQLPITFKLFF
jgi:hypothetical protein